MNSSTRSLDVTLEALSSLSLRGERNKLETLIHDCFLPNIRSGRRISGLSADGPFLQEARDIRGRVGWDKFTKLNDFTLRDIELCS
jgi:hypothetical protein